jgi:hypothetical protein
MKRIEYGACAVKFELDDDGFVNGSVTGVMLPNNAGVLAAMLLRAGADHDSSGVLVSVQKTLVALPRIGVGHYDHIPSLLRSVPVAVLIMPEQLGVYEDVAQAASATGSMRRAFLSREQAHDWLREQARALQANRVWRRAHR